MTTKTTTQQAFFLLCLSLILLLLLPTISAFYYQTPNTDDTDFIHTSCGATLYPDLCFTSLSSHATTIHQSSAQLARIATLICLNKAKRLTMYVANLARQTNSGTAEPRAIAALHDCYSTFGDAVDQISRSVKEMRTASGGTREALRFQLSNVQTWMSAALTNEDTCTDGFQDVSNGTMKTDVCGKVVLVKMYTSNALALVNSYVTNATQVIY